MQVSHFGWPATTGIETIHYRITDGLLDPSGTTEKFCTEQLVRLPDCAWIYTGADDAPEAASEPPSVAAGHITFGCLNKPIKISEPCAELWARILWRVPHSRLMLLGEPNDKATAGIPRLRLTHRSRHLRRPPVAARQITLINLNATFWDILWDVSTAASDATARRAKDRTPRGRRSG